MELDLRPEVSELMNVNPESQPRPVKNTKKPPNVFTSLLVCVRVCVRVAPTVTHYLFMLMCHTGCLIAVEGTQALAVPRRTRGSHSQNPETGSHVSHK